MELKKEKHLDKLLSNFNHGLNICFPVIKAYVVVGNEDDDYFVDGLPLNSAAYYELPPIQNFHLTTNNDFNPLDVCTFSVINPSGMRSALEDHLDITNGMEKNFYAFPIMVNYIEKIAYNYDNEMF